MVQYYHVEFLCYTHCHVQAMYSIDNVLGFAEVSGGSGHGSFDFDS